MKRPSNGRRHRIKNSKGGLCKRAAFLLGFPLSDISWESQLFPMLRAEGVKIETPFVRVRVRVVSREAAKSDSEKRPQLQAPQLASLSVRLAPDGEALERPIYLLVR